LQLCRQFRRHFNTQTYTPVNPGIHSTGYWFRPAAGPEPPAEPAAAEPTEPPRKEFADMTPAERYVSLYPRRAAAVLAHGGMPPQPDFPSPDPEELEDLLTSTSPIVRAFARRMQDAPAAA
jgi:hypothetical protein